MRYSVNSGQKQRNYFFERAWILAGRAVCVWVFLLEAQRPPLAADKSGVSPQSISLPSGPGSVEGLGESFEPQLNSGTFVYRVPLKLPPIRGAAAPGLVLEYNSGSGNGWLGMGWRLNLPRIQRMTDRGLPAYTEADAFVEESGEELVRLADGSFRLENEWSFTRYERLANGGWLGRLRDGSKIWLGTSPQSRLTSSTNEVFCWMIEAMEDPNGNRCEYHYALDRGQLYPSEIVYGLHRTEASATFRLVFDYDDIRPDPVVDYRSRFRVETRRRLAGVTVLFGQRRIRRWEIGYESTGPVSLLSSVKMFGDERSRTNNAAQANVDFLPPIHFSYSTMDLTKNWRMGSIQLQDGVDFHSNLAEFVDVNHDGLPDIVMEQNGELYSILNAGPDRKWPLSEKIENRPVGTAASMAKLTTRFVDLRGDGRSRLLVPQSVAPDGSATSFYYCDFVTPTHLSAPIDFSIDGQFQIQDPNVQLVDVNNDKAVDLLRLDAGLFGGVSALLNGQVEGQTNRVILADPPRSDVSFSAGWQLADMNGDRLQDLVLLQDMDSTLVCLNRGMGRFEPPYVMKGGAPRDLMLQGSGPLLADLDHDGLADLVVIMNGSVNVWLNQGGSKWSDRIAIQGDEIPDFSGATTAIRFADINGNGSTDIVWTEAGSATLRYLDLNPGDKAWLLTSVTNTLGAFAAISYRSSVEYLLDALGTPNPWTSAAPFPLPVVSRIREGDGLGNNYTNEFTYRNVYYDGVKKEFRGFEEAVRVELGDDAQGAPSLVTRLRFDTGAAQESLKGKPLEVQAATTAGAVFYRQTNQWSARRLSFPIASGEKRSVTFASQSRKVTQEVELGSEGDAVTLEEEYTYDDYGNQIRLADYGRVEKGDRSAWNDERIQIRQFSSALPGGTNLWILNRLIQEETQDLAGNIFARKRIYYDDPAFSGTNFGVVNLGNPTLTRDWIDIANNLFRSTLRQEYDPFGNMTAAYDPLGVPGKPEVGHSRRVLYDSVIHTEPVEESIYTGNPDVIASGTPASILVMRADYDLGLGVLRSATNFNQNATSYSFDTFGRLVSITKPYDSTNLPTALFEYVLQQPLPNGMTANHLTTRLREKAGQTNTYDTRVFFDGLRRKLMTRSDSETNGVVVVEGGTVFNQRRSAWRSFLPHFSSGTLAFSPLVLTNDFVELHYDALGREIEKSQPSTQPDRRRAFSRTIYGPLTSLSLDEEQTRTNGVHYGAAMRHTEDGLRNEQGKGRLRLVEEIVKLGDNGSSSSSTNVWRTSYGYDPLDNFLGYSDSQGNQKEFRFDALSRKVFMNDPDRGMMSWAYDAGSNVTNTFDAKGQRIAFAYDGANRLLAETYFDGKSLPRWRGASPSSASVAYHYDLPAPKLDSGSGTAAVSSNTLGKVAWVADLSGEEHTSYDARGRVAFVIKRIPDLQFLASTNAALSLPLVNYRTGFAYDSLDRLTDLEYPDHDAIAYNYNDRNVLDGIVGGINGLTRGGRVIEHIGYRASGQLDSITYGNGVVTRYGYDARLRLSSLITTQPSSGTQAGAELINFSYDFDDASNIKTIFDNRPAASIPAGDPRRNTQIYAYDDLYRLIFAGYALGGPGVTNLDGGSISYKYDRIGNMLSQVSTIDQSDPLTGLPVANLGQMLSGGAAGRFNRTGRTAGEPPGPHALSAIAPTNAPVRTYSYDANGNMTILDGLTNTWDFKDRLVAVESDQMRAEYLYDYSDRRIVKNVTAKRIGSIGAVVTNDITTAYINKYFEVRNHDEPVKYVWNGETRVARVTGSLTANERVQRIRLWPGMNLMSLAVSPTTPVSSWIPPVVQGIYKWNPGSLGWLLVSSNETLQAGAVLWVQGATNAVLTVNGSYADPGKRSATIGPNFLATAGLELFPIAGNAALATNTWRYDAKNQAWQISVFATGFQTGGLPTELAPGEAIFVRADAAVAIDPRDPLLSIRYYHQDHLGSSHCLTDLGAQPIESTSFYPFGEGRLRHGQRNISRNSYLFAQKEQDEESGMQYFEARFVSGICGRFLNPDPLLGEMGPSRLALPASINGYSYCLNRPINHLDPNGEEAHPSWLAVLGEVKDAYTAGVKTGEGIGALIKGNYNEAKSKFIEVLADATVGKAGERVIAKHLLNPLYKPVVEKIVGKALEKTLEKALLDEGRPYAFDRKGNLMPADGVRMEFGRNGDLRPKAGELFLANPKRDAENLRRDLSEYQIHQREAWQLKILPAREASPSHASRDFTTSLHIQ